MPTLTENSLDSSKEFINRLLTNANLPGCRVYFKSEDLSTNIFEIIPLLPKYELPVSPTIKNHALFVISRTFHENHRTLAANLKVFTQLYLEQQLQDKEEENPITGYLEINQSDIIEIQAKREVRHFEPVQWTENFRLGPLA